MLHNPKGKCNIILKRNHYSKLGHIVIIIVILMHSIIRDTKKLLLLVFQNTHCIIYYPGSMYHI